MTVQRGDDRGVAERDEMRPDRPEQAGRDGQHTEVEERVQLERNGEAILPNDSPEPLELGGRDDALVLPAAEPLDHRHRARL